MVKATGRVPSRRDNINLENEKPKLSQARELKGCALSCFVGTRVYAGHERISSHVASDNCLLSFSMAATAILTESPCMPGTMRIPEKRPLGTTRTPNISPLPTAGT